MKSTRKILAVDPAPCVYFIQRGSNGPIKIGYTESGLHQRLVNLQAEAKVGLNVVGVIQDEKPRALESALHAIFQELRLDGEWFRPAPSLLEYVEMFTSAVDRKNMVEIYFKEDRICVECNERSAVTTDGKLCKRCLRAWSRNQTPSQRVEKSRNRTGYRSDDEEDPSFENTVRAIEDAE